MGTAPAFASLGEAMDMARAALGYLAAADAAQLAAAELAECLPGRSPNQPGPRSSRPSSVKP